MDPEQVKAIIESGIEGATATVTADGNKYTAVVVADAFEGMKMVYALLNEHIQSGVIHALTIKAYTPAEYDKL